MSRMPGPGTGPGVSVSGPGARVSGPGTGAVGRVIGSTFYHVGGHFGRWDIGWVARRRQLGGGERHGVAAESQQPIEIRPELFAQAVEARVAGRHETVELHQRVRSLGVLARRHEGAVETEPG